MNLADKSLNNVAKNVRQACGTDDPGFHAVCPAMTTPASQIGSDAVRSGNLRARPFALLLPGFA